MNSLNSVNLTYPTKIKFCFYRTNNSFFIWVFFLCVGDIFRATIFWAKPFLIHDFWNLLSHCSHSDTQSTFWCQTETHAPVGYWHASNHAFVIELITTVDKHTRCWLSSPSRLLMFVTTCEVVIGCLGLILGGFLCCPSSFYKDDDVNKILNKGP